MQRVKLPPKRGHITQKAKIGTGRTLYLSVDGDPPQEIFLRIKGVIADAEKVVAFDVIARLISLALQYGIPLDEIAGRMEGTHDDTGGPVRGDARIKMCHGTIDYVGKHLLVYYGGRDDLAHVKHEPNHPQKAAGEEKQTESPVQAQTQPGAEIPQAQTAAQGPDGTSTPD